MIGKGSNLFSEINGGWEIPQNRKKLYAKMIEQIKNAASPAHFFFLLNRDSNSPEKAMNRTPKSGHKHSFILYQALDLRDFLRDAIIRLFL